MFFRAMCSLSVTARLSTLQSWIVRLVKISYSFQTVVSVSPKVPARARPACRIWRPIIESYQENYPNHGEHATSQILLALLTRLARFWLVILLHLSTLLLVGIENVVAYNRQGLGRIVQRTPVEDVHEAQCAILPSLVTSALASHDGHLVLAIV